MKRFAQVVVCQCSHGRAGANVGGQNLPASDVIYQYPHQQSRFYLFKNVLMWQDRKESIHAPIRFFVECSSRHLVVCFHAHQYGCRAARVTCRTDVFTAILLNSHSICSIDWIGHHISPRSWIRCTHARVSFFTSGCERFVTSPS